MAIAVAIHRQETERWRRAASSPCILPAPSDVIRVEGSASTSTVPLACGTTLAHPRGHLGSGVANIDSGRMRYCTCGRRADVAFVSPDIPCLARRIGSGIRARGACAEIESVIG